MKKVLITGGAGFIGCNLTKQLLKKGYEVVCVDNFELGTQEKVALFMKNLHYTLYEEDASQMEVLASILKKHQIDRVYHLAANSDIQKSSAEPGIDLRNTFMTTYSVLEAMRVTNVKELFFASTSAVYGDKPDFKLCEGTGELMPISYYGGAKLASEAFISAYTAMNDMNTVVFRFANVIGPHLTHGVIYDFIRKLEKNPTQLLILGDGSQCKPYIYVEDLVDAILRMTEEPEQGTHVFNVGVESATSVKEIADMVCAGMGLQNVKYSFTDGNRGWKGDVPRFQFDLERIYNTGWRPQYSSREAVQKTIKKVLEEIKK